MSNQRYILLDSTYRNRKEWDLPAEFEVQLSTTGSRRAQDAFDPLAQSAPVLCWKSNAFDDFSSNSSVNIELCKTGGTPAPINNSNTTQLLNICATTSGTLQDQNNYYRGAVLCVYDCSDLSPTAPCEARCRIVTYDYTGNSSYDRAYIEIVPALSIDVYNKIADGTYCMKIVDPTDVESTPDNKLIFIPSGIESNNAYINYIMYNETKCNYAYITGNEGVTHIAEIDVEKQPSCWHDDPSNSVSNWENDDRYCIRLEPPSFVGEVGTILDCEITSNTIPIKCLNYPQSYVNDFLRIKTTNNVTDTIQDEIRQIKSVCCPTGGADPILYFCDSFTEPPLPGDKIEILRVTRDNEVPYNYSGSFLSQQEEVFYQVQLLSLILPNQVLDVPFGSRIAFYPYVIVEFSNTCGSSAGMKNIIYTNNPNAVKALFIVPITDINDPDRAPFIHLYGQGQVQIVKFKPNDNLRMVVRLPNGEIFKTIIEESYSPRPPNPLKQIAAVFGIKRL